MRKFGLFLLWVTAARGWTERFRIASLDENFLIKESTAKALLSGHPNAKGNVKIQSLYGSWNEILWRRCTAANEVSLIAYVTSVSGLFRSKEWGTRHFLFVVSFFPRSKPKIPFHGLFWLRNQTETLATQAMSLTESVRPESSHSLFSVSQNKQSTCDRKLNRQVVFWFAWLLFVETKGTINKLWELCFNFLNNFWNNINEAKNRGNE